MPELMRCTEMVQEEKNFTSYIRENAELIDSIKSRTNEIQFILFGSPGVAQNEVTNSASCALDDVKLQNKELSKILKMLEVMAKSI